MNGIKGRSRKEKCLTIGGVGGRVLDVGKQDAVVTITSSGQTSSTNGEEVSVVA